MQRYMQLQNLFRLCSNRMRTCREQKTKKRIQNGTYILPDKNMRHFGWHIAILVPFEANLNFRGLKKRLSHS